MFKRTIKALEKVFKAIFCEVPAFRRVLPEMTSEPVSRVTPISASMATGASTLLAKPIVRAPAARAARRAPSTYGVPPEAAISRTTSSAGDVHGVQVGRALVDVVLGPFDGDEHGVVAAGQQRHGAPVRPGEGGIQFNAVEHAQAARGAGADIHQAPARFHARQRGGHGGGDAGRGGAHGVHRIHLVVHQHVDQFRGRVLVEQGVVLGWGFGFQHGGVLTDCLIKPV